MSKVEFHKRIKIQRASLYHFYIFLLRFKIITNSILSLSPTMQCSLSSTNSATPTRVPTYTAHDYLKLIKFEEGRAPGYGVWQLFDDILYGLSKSILYQKNNAALYRQAVEKHGVIPRRVKCSTCENLYTFKNSKNVWQ